MVLDHDLPHEGQFPADRPDPLAELERRLLTESSAITFSIEQGRGPSDLYRHVERIVREVRAGTTETPPAPCTCAESNAVGATSSDYRCSACADDTALPAARDTTGEDNREALTEVEVEQISEWVPDDRAYLMDTIVDVVNGILADRRAGEGDLRARIESLADEWDDSTAGGHPACMPDEDCVGCAADQVRAALAAQPAQPTPNEAR